MKKYDVVVIGWGKGGKTLSAHLAKNNKKVAIIEKDPKMYGGTCVNVGCLPTKSFVHFSKVLEQVNKLGLKTTQAQNHEAFTNASNYKEKFVKLLNSKNFANLDNLENVDIYNGFGSFVDKNHIKVQYKDKEDEIIYADKVIINTGSYSRKLASDVVVESKNVLYSDDFLDLKDLPQKALVIGAGFIGLEFATMLNNFSSEVSVYQFDNSFMKSEDPEDAAKVLEVMKNQNINFSFNTQVKKIVDVNNKAHVTSLVDGKEVTEIFDKVLVSIGRVPNIEKLQLQNAGVEIKNGAIEVNEYLKTNVENIWAIGDCKGGLFFTYISYDDFRIVLPQLLNKDSNRTTLNRPIVPWSTFIDPSYARVGLNETQAQKLNIEYEVHNLKTMQMPKAHVINELVGFNKILVDKNGYIIGATLFNYEASEMINMLSLAIVYKIKFTDIKNFIYTHPIFIENLNEF
ncbi:NAD(P)/FAD-dependent oxidoreductase [Mycoplasmopsis ciconiae]|uniref:NAD(P)/FAD-dependent oxidoreductase n=1 Tax=Mycoplasmopsis ciconiae TaxID=561067 RepID=A0ABU7MKV1_9BACT|nr:NAD(P)/FAD-dependent oxidoreductase [Mycoplasmopsis ciconiae]